MSNWIGSPLTGGSHSQSIAHYEPDFRPPPWWTTTATITTSDIWDAIRIPAPTKEKKMTTKDIVARARDDKRKEQAEQLLDHITREFATFEKVPGTLITAVGSFPDRDTEYHYAWVYGSNRRWYGTNRVGGWTTEQMIEELVRLVLDADKFTWDMVGQEVATPRPVKPSAGRRK